MKIAIAGKKTETDRYVRALTSLNIPCLVTLNTGDITTCDALILPGGGDITPGFFGEQNRGSRTIDTELDILQLQAFFLCLGAKKPILGICKGMQLINVGLGGTIQQDMVTASLHTKKDGDLYHVAVQKENSWIYNLYGATATVNSSHHQSLKKLGSGISVVQSCPFDHCPEAISHDTLPIIGVQWHPERIDATQTSLYGASVFLYFVSLIS